MKSLVLDVGRVRLELIIVLSPLFIALTLTLIHTYASMGLTYHRSNNCIMLASLLDTFYEMGTLFMEMGLHPVILSLRISTLHTFYHGYYVCVVLSC